MAVTIDGVRYSWNQPICDADWERIEPGREPMRMHEAFRRAETCSYCGGETWTGIYRRDDPRTVPFPAREDDE